MNLAFFDFWQVMHFNFTPIEKCMVKTTVQIFSSKFIPYFVTAFTIVELLNQSYSDATMVLDYK